MKIYYMTYLGDNINVIMLFMEIEYCSIIKANFLATWDSIKRIRPFPDYFGCRPL